MKIIRVIFAIIVLTISIYGLKTGNFKYQPFMLLFLGGMLIINGIIELKEKQKKFSFKNLNIVVTTFLFVVSVIGFFSN